jgi:hypothetical protein
MFNRSVQLKSSVPEIITIMYFSDYFKYRWKMFDMGVVGGSATLPLPSPHSRPNHLLQSFQTSTSERMKQVEEMMEDYKRRHNMEAIMKDANLCKRRFVQNIYDGFWGNGFGWLLSSFVFAVIYDRTFVLKIDCCTSRATARNWVMDRRQSDELRKVQNCSEALTEVEVPGRCCHVNDIDGSVIYSIVVPSSTRPSGTFIHCLEPYYLLNQDAGRIFCSDTRIRSWENTIRMGFFITTYFRPRQML